MLKTTEVHSKPPPTVSAFDSFSTQKGSSARHFSVTFGSSVQNPQPRNHGPQIAGSLQATKKIYSATLQRAESKPKPNKLVAKRRATANVQEPRRKTKVVWSQEEAKEIRGILSARLPETRRAVTKISTEDMSIYFKKVLASHELMLYKFDSHLKINTQQSYRILYKFMAEHIGHMLAYLKSTSLPQIEVIQLASTHFNALVGSEKSPAKLSIQPDDVISNVKRWMATFAEFCIILNKRENEICEFVKKFELLEEESMLFKDVLRQATAHNQDSQQMQPFEVVIQQLTVLDKSGSMKSRSKADKETDTSDLPETELTQSSESFKSLEPFVSLDESVFEPKVEVKKRVEPAKVSDKAKPTVLISSAPNARSVPLKHVANTSTSELARAANTPETHLSTKAESAIHPLNQNLSIGSALSVYSNTASLMSQSNSRSLVEIASQTDITGDTNSRQCSNENVSLISRSASASLSPSFLTRRVSMGLKVSTATVQCGLSTPIPSYTVSQAQTDDAMAVMERTILAQKIEIRSLNQKIQSQLLTHAGLKKTCDSKIGSVTLNFERTLETMLHSVSGQCECLRLALDKLHQVQRQSDAAKIATRKSMQELTENNQKLEEEVRSSEDERARLESEVETVSMKVFMLETDVLNLQEALLVAKTDRSRELASEYEELIKFKADAEQKISHMESQLMRQQLELKEAKTTSMSSKNRAGELHHELVQLQGRHEELEELYSGQQIALKKAEFKAREQEAIVELMMKYPDASLGCIMDETNVRYDNVFSNMISANNLRISLLEQKNNEYRMIRLKFACAADTASKDLAIQQPQVHLWANEKLITSHQDSSFHKSQFRVSIPQVQSNESLDEADRTSSLLLQSSCADERAAPAHAITLKKAAEHLLDRPGVTKPKTNKVHLYKHHEKLIISKIGQKLHSSQAVKPKTLVLDVATAEPKRQHPANEHLLVKYQLLHNPLDELSIPAKKPGGLNRKPNQTRYPEDELRKYASSRNSITSITMEDSRDCDTDRSSQCSSGSKSATKSSLWRFE
ncbi:hypothetical protein HDU77_008869 [Chytriomyces hyalinus]|nr:hypothetical protein HDU77_008869 [Chytriomyces hyalinus]